MTQAVLEAGYTKVVTATGVSTLGNGNPCAMIGIFVASVATSQLVSVWSQTAGSVTGLPVIVAATMATNTFYRIPGFFPQGIVYNVSNDSPNLTIFWQPSSAS